MSSMPLLSAENAALLRAVQRLGMSEAATIANGIGRSPGRRLDDLVDAGLVKRQASHRPDKRRTTLYSISGAGERRLAAFDRATEVRRAKSNRPAGIAATRAAHLFGYHGATYRGQELLPYQGRPGAMDAFTLPSRMGNRLHYRDGRIVHLEIPE